METSKHLIRFAELHSYSNFSFLKAASHPEELVQQAFDLGYSAITIADECSVAGVVRGWRQFKLIKSKSDQPFQYIIGSSFHYEDHVFVVIADRMETYSQLCQLISHCRINAEKGQYNFIPDDLTKFIRSGFILWRPGRNSSSHFDIAKTLKLHRDKTDTQVFSLLNLTLTSDDQVKLSHAESLEQKFQFSIIATNSALMHHRNRKMLHDALCAIRLNQPITEIQDQLQPNAEHHLRTLTHLSRIYQSKHLLNSIELAEKCHFDLSILAYHYPEETVPPGFQAHYYLRQQTWQGAHKRYHGNIPEKVKSTLKKEFKLIQLLKYEYYFLTVYDITQFAKSKKILHQGRGSAANSAVCFCLGITEVDPSKINLLFERFISKNRGEPPDIDVDFDNSRREEVIQYLYKKYSRDRCAIAATVITYRAKSALRDLGKALGLDMVHLETVIANYGWRYRSKDWVDEIIDQNTSENSHVLHCFKELIKQILGFPRHLSQHVGGFVLSQKPISTLVPIENATMENRTVIQWDKDDLEAVSLMKIDVLALGMLAALQKCLDELSKLNGKTFQLQDIPRDDDPNVYHMLQKADTVGLFQVESRAQMNMLPRLKPEKFYDLVVQVAIVRPGPIHGEMVHPYLKRKRGEEKIDMPLKSMMPILERTFGVPIFQEQVIALAMQAADFSPDEAEQLRKSMASWKQQGHMNSLRGKLQYNLAQKGVTDEYIQRICQQIEGFGEYGFPESHAASFALIAYFSAWMKHYHPAIFLNALLNSQPMGFYPPWQLIQDAQRHGVTVLPVDVNTSEWSHTIKQVNKELQVQLGFRIVKGLSKTTGDKISTHRPSKGYQTISEIMLACHLSQSDANALAGAHAFQSLGGNRFENRWLAQSYNYYNGLFLAEPANTKIDTHASRLDQFLEDLNATGVTLSDHPMAYLREEGVFEDCTYAKDLINLKPKSETFVAGIVTNRQRPKTSKGVTFLTLEDETGSINLVVWLDTAKRQLKELTHSKIIKAYGQIDKDDTESIVHLIAYRLIDVSDKLKDYDRNSRDYH